MLNAHQTRLTFRSFLFSLDEHNCLIAYSGLVDDNFPWAQFCLVVEYEYQSDSVWKDHCERQNIRHIAVKLNTGDRPGNMTALGLSITIHCGIYEYLDIASLEQKPRF